MNNIKCKIEDESNNYYLFSNKIVDYNNYFMIYNTNANKYQIKM